MPASGVSGLLQYKNDRLESAKGRRGLFRAFHLGPDFSQRGWELGDDLIGVRMAASSGPILRPAPFRESLAGPRISANRVAVLIRVYSRPIAIPILPL